MIQDGNNDPADSSLLLSFLGAFCTGSLIVLLSCSRDQGDLSVVTATANGLVLINISLGGLTSLTNQTGAGRPDTRTSKILALRMFRGTSRCRQDSWYEERRVTTDQPRESSSVTMAWWCPPVRSSLPPSSCVLVTVRPTKTHYHQITTLCTLYCV